MIEITKISINLSFFLYRSISVYAHTIHTSCFWNFDHRPNNNPHYFLRGYSYSFLKGVVMCVTTAVLVGKYAGLHAAAPSTWSLVFWLPLNIPSHLLSVTHIERWASVCVFAPSLPPALSPSLCTWPGWPVTPAQQLLLENKLRRRLRFLGPDRCCSVSCCPEARVSMHSRSLS